MSYRPRAGLGVAPLLLRLALAATFTWAGLGKIMSQIPVSGSRAAALANMGIRIPGAPVLPAPSMDIPIIIDPAAPPPDAQPADGFREPSPGVKSLAPGAPSETPAPAAPTPASPAPAKSTQLGYAPSDFPEPVSVRAVYGISIWLHTAANPAPAEDGTARRPLWPSRLAQDRTPVYLAWLVAITEVAGGLFLLLGLMTRLSALGVACIMVGAIWLEQIGPAMQTGQTVLGFLPDRPRFDAESWRPLLFQFTLLMSALAVVFAGPGRLALDNALFGRRRGDDDDDSE